MKKLLVLISALYSLIAFTQNLNSRRHSLYQILEQAQSPSEKVRAWQEISEDYGQTGQPDSSRFASEEMFRIATDSRQDSLLAPTYLDFAYYFYLTGDYKQALEFYFKSLRFAEKSKSVNDIWLATKEIGSLFKELKNYSEALKYLKKAKTFLNTQNISSSSAANRTYTHIAETFLGLRQIDSALRYVQLTNEVTSKETDAYGFARMLYIFASVYKEKGDADLAESYYKKCIAFSDAENISLPYITATTDYGQYLFTAKQYSLAKAYVLSGFTKAKQAGNKLGMINAASLLRKAYYAVEQKDSSYYYADIKDLYSDSIFNEQQRNQIQNLSFAQKIKENEDQAKQKAYEEERKQNLQYALIALGIIALVTIYLLLSRSFITNPKIIKFFGVIALLIVFEFLNLLLHPFLERITHHSPVLMLLALVCIAALLVPLHHKLEHSATTKLVEKNKKIRLAAAKKTIAELEKNNSTT